MIETMSARTPARSWLPRALTLTALAGTMFAVACSDSPSEPSFDLWKATLEGSEAYEQITGDAEVVASSSAFVAGIEISGADADEAFSWAVVEGTCAEPGDLVGTAGGYPALEADGDGEASAEANVSVRLEPSDSYHVRVEAEHDGEALLVACGALELS